jgi:hypothetical protein
MQNLQILQRKIRLTDRPLKSPQTPLYQRGAGGISGRRLALGKADFSGCGFAALCPLWLYFDNAEYTEEVG